MKSFAKGHFTQDIERVHLEPLGHVDSAGSGTASFANDPDELIDDTVDDLLLLQEAALREGGVEHLAHGGVLLRVSLAAHAFAAEAGCEDFVEWPFGGYRPSGWLVSVDGLPGLDAGEGKLIGGNADNWPCSYDSG